MGEREVTIYVERRDDGRGYFIEISEEMMPYFVDIVRKGVEPGVTVKFVEYDWNMIPQEVFSEDTDE